MSELQAFFTEANESLNQPKTLNDLKEEVKQYIESGNVEWNYVYFTFHKLGILPQELAKMSIKERAIIFAFIDEYVAANKENTGKDE